MARARGDGAAGGEKQPSQMAMVRISLGGMGGGVASAASRVRGTATGAEVLPPSPPAPLPRGERGVKKANNRARPGGLHFTLASRAAGCHHARHTRACGGTADTADLKSAA